MTTEYLGNGITRYTFNGGNSIEISAEEQQEILKMSQEYKDLQDQKDLLSRIETYVNKINEILEE